VGGDNEWKNLDLIHLLCDTVDRHLGRPVGTSRKLITFVQDRAGHDQRYAINAAKARNELGWKAEIGLDKGLMRTITWYLSGDGECLKNNF
jgi:dTDP-glucose 4,6-dehydratase